MERSASFTVILALPLLLPESGSGFSTDVIVAVLFKVSPAVPESTVAVMVYCAPLPGTLLRVHVGAPLVPSLQPFVDTKVRPEGRLSVTTTSETVFVDALEILIVKVMVSPSLGVGSLTDLLSERSTGVVVDCSVTFGKNPIAFEPVVSLAALRLGLPSSTRSAISASPDAE